MHFYFVEHTQKPQAIKTMFLMFIHTGWWLIADEWEFNVFSNRSSEWGKAFLCASHLYFFTCRIDSGAEKIANEFWCSDAEITKDSARVEFPILGRARERIIIFQMSISHIKMHIKWSSAGFVKREAHDLNIATRFPFERDISSSSCLELHKKCIKWNSHRKELLMEYKIHKIVAGFNFLRNNAPSDANRMLFTTILWF